MPLGSRANSRPSFTELRELSSAIRAIDPKIHIHFDFSRIWEIAIDSGNRFSWQEELLQYGELGDSLTVCLSKQLSAPVGGFLVGSKAFMEKAKKESKALGGVMHQTGPLGASILASLHEDFISQIRANNSHCRQFIPMLQARIAALNLSLEIIYSESSMVFVKGSEDEVEKLQCNLDDLKIKGLRLNRNIIRYTFSNLIGQCEMEILDQKLTKHL